MCYEVCVSAVRFCLVESEGYEGRCITFLGSRTMCWSSATTYLSLIPGGQIAMENELHKVHIAWYGSAKQCFSNICIIPTIEYEQISINKRYTTTYFWSRQYVNADHQIQASKQCNFMYRYQVLDP